MYVLRNGSVVAGYREAATCSLMTRGHLDCVSGSQTHRCHMRPPRFQDDQPEKMTFPVCVSLHEQLSDQLMERRHHLVNVQFVKTFYFSCFPSLV